MIVYRELSTLEKELGISVKTLYAISNNIDKHYRKVTVPKKNGGERRLTVPDAVLKSVQRAIVEKLLVYEPISRYATAYAYGTSIRKNAIGHIGKKMLLKLDIQDFFDSIRYAAVKEKAFPKERFSESIRILLSTLCYHHESLPQGAPSSPTISNLIMRDFDMRVGAWCDVRKITYTRYCDDMAFSGDFSEKELIAFVSLELKKEGFLLNCKKTVIAPSSKRQSVTGIVVNQVLNVSREYRRKIRQEIFYIQKYGLREHMNRLGIQKDEVAYLQVLLGKLSFVLQINPDDSQTRRQIAFVRSLLKEKGL